MADCLVPKRLVISRVLAAIAMLTGVYMFLEYAPPMAAPDGTPLGEAFRIFFFHVPAAWVASLVLFVSFVASIGYLMKRMPSWDRAAAACAEVGWIFCSIVIITGPIWGRAAWGTYWTWEPRLTSFLVLWLLYLSYLMLRGAIDDPDKRARYSAVLSILAFLDVPLIFVSIKLWGSVAHPKPSLGFFQDPLIRNTVIVNGLAYLLLAAHLVMKRMEVARRET